jgi:SAM-dependent methyltransferase
VTAKCDGPFEEGYFSHYAGHGAYRDDRLKRVFRTRLVSRFLSSGTILEIGCAYGYLLRALEDRFQCAGMDVSDHAISVARTTTKASVECGDVMELLPWKPECSFDGVLAFDILEHLPERQLPGVLGQIARILRPGGRLLVSVPNTRCLSRKLKKEQWAGLRDATHVSLLSPERWLELLAASFTILATGGDALWDIPYLPVVPRQLQRAFLLTPALAAAANGRFPRSLSENVIIVAEKAVPSARSC